MSKLCPKCGVTKANDAFYTRPNGNLHSWCIACTKILRVQRNPEIAAYQKKRRAARTESDKERAKDYLLRWNFGISLEEYKQKLEAQDGCCAICGRESGTEKHSGNKTKQLSVDHNHKTGLVRGLLCNDCNHAIGQLGEDPAILRKAAEYLEQWESTHADEASVGAKLIDELEKS